MPLAEVSADISNFLLWILEREVNRREQRRTEVMNVLLLALAIVPPCQKAPPNVSIFQNITAGLRGDSRWMPTYRQVIRRHGNSELSLTCVDKYVG